MRELDIVLQRYLNETYPHATSGEQAEFARLLEQPDTDIMDWLLGRQAAPEDLSDVIRALRPRS